MKISASKYRVSRLVLLGIPCSACVVAIVCVSIAGIGGRANAEHLNPPAELAARSKAARIASTWPGVVSAMPNRSATRNARPKGFQGVILPSRVVSISVAEPGPLMWCRPKGEWVEAGTVVGAVDNTDARMALMEGEAALRAAYARQEAAMLREMAAQERLERRSAAGLELFSAEALREEELSVQGLKRELEAAEALVDQARAQRERSLFRMQLTKIVSPVSGVVLGVEPAGKVLQQGEVALTIGETEPLLVRFEMPQDDMWSLRSGSALVVLPVGPGPAMLAKLVRIDRRMSSAAGISVGEAELWLEDQTTIGAVLEQPVTVRESAEATITGTGSDVM